MPEMASLPSSSSIVTCFSNTQYFVWKNLPQIEVVVDGGMGGGWWM